MDVLNYLSILNLTAPDKADRLFASACNVQHSSYLQIAQISSDSLSSSGRSDSWIGEEDPDSVRLSTEDACEYVTGGQRTGFDA